MNISKAQSLIDQIWAHSIVPKLCDYIHIPSKSPFFDSHWQSNGYLNAAAELMVNWCNAQSIDGMHVEIIQIEQHTPLIFIDIPGEGDNCVLLYGHLDKQPEMDGWRSNLGPWKPVVENDRLYGRGGADDGYALFAAITALSVLEDQRLPHARCVILIEACEESGSGDLPFYIEALAARIGIPSLVICLDSGAGDYERLWCTTSLRGLVSGTLSVQVLKEGVHSGDAGGIIASSFRIIRHLLGRLEEASTGTILPAVFYEAIPQQRQEQARRAAQILGDEVYKKFPLVMGMQPIGEDITELILNRTWRPALCVTGAAGLPPVEDAGNVLRTKTEIKLSLRLPPTCDAAQAIERLQALLETEPPYKANVRFIPELHANGWDAPMLSPLLEKSIDEASKAFFGKPVAYLGEGGTIPFMGMLGARFPCAQFLITGVLGPQSNAHGPNEFLHIPTAKKISGCIASVIADHYCMGEEQDI